MRATAPDDVEETVLVQDRSRLFRESLALLLGALAPFRSGRAVATADDLEALGREHPRAAVVMEGAGVPWDVAALLARLRGTRTLRPVVVTVPIGMHRHDELSGVPVVARTARVEDFGAALAGGGGAPPLARPARGVPGDLSAPELQVLALISAGLTAELIARRLKIPVKAVERHRQRIFAKLGVQSQAHAVTVAFRTGLLGMAAAPDDRA